MADQKFMTSSDFDTDLNPRVIFIKSALFQIFLENDMYGLSPKVVMVGNGDTNFDKKINVPLGVNLVLCQNLIGDSNEEISLMPIGLENLSIGKSGVPRFFQHPEHHLRSLRLMKVLVPPMSQTNPMRHEVLTEKNGVLDLVFDVTTNYLTSKHYFELVRKYRFILCLEGNGYDTHRVWESLYHETFPVMLNTPWTRTLRGLGLPILIVDDISEVSQDCLHEFARNNSDFCSVETEILWMPYWRSTINRALSEVL